jgi:hypothetical protein
VEGPELLGVPLDSMALPTPNLDPETLWVDTIPGADTLANDTTSALDLD